MAAPKPIQIILARQLASSLATPILIVDTDGTLIYYNEPAEVILDQRFDETGEVPADVPAQRPHAHDGDPLAHGPLPCHVRPDDLPDRP